MKWVADTAAFAMKGAWWYVSEAAAGAAAYGYLGNIQKGCAEEGAKIAGPIGRKIGGFAGRVIAGASIQDAKEGQKAIAGAAYRAGTMAIDTLQNTPSTEAKSGWSETGWNVAKGVAVAAGGLAVGAALPVAVSAVAVAAMTQGPAIYKAFTKDVKNSPQPSLVDDVVLPVAKAVTIQAATMAVGNLIRMDVIDAAHAARIEECKAVGKTLGSYLPETISSYCEKAGEIVGNCDAGRYAMSDQVVQMANTSAEIGENVVYGALNIVDAAVPSKPADAPSTNWDIARKTAIIGTGVIAAAALTVAAPEVAAVTLVVAGLHTAANFISYMRTPAKAEQPKTTIEKVEVVVKEKAAFDKSALTAMLKPLVTATPETYLMAAVAA